MLVFANVIYLQPLCMVMTMYALVLLVDSSSVVFRQL